MRFFASPFLFAYAPFKEARFGNPNFPRPFRSIAKTGHFELAFDPETLRVEPNERASYEFVFENGVLRETVRIEGTRYEKKAMPGFEMRTKIRKEELAEFEAKIAKFFGLVHWGKIGDLNEEQTLRAVTEALREHSALCLDGFLVSLAEDKSACAKIQTYGSGEYAVLSDWGLSRKESEMPEARPLEGNRAKLAFIAAAQLGKQEKKAMQAI